MLDGNDEVEIAMRECKPDNEHSRDTCSTKLRERVIHASDGRTLGYPESSRRGSKEYEPNPSDGLSDSLFSVGSRHERFIDDITKQPLDPELCRIARRKEIDYFKSKGVWEVRQIKEDWSKTGRPPISVRWVEVNKGDGEHPNYRSRLVAREIRMAGEEAIFAPTPPLESLRMVISCLLYTSPSPRDSR